MATSTAQKPTPVPTEMKSDDRYAELNAQIETLRADISKLTETMGDIAKGEVQGARKRVDDAAQDMRKRGRRAARQARVEAERDMEIAADYVRERPFAAVAGAAALGMLFGFLTARR